jgi:hypothetical protein
MQNTNVRMIQARDGFCFTLEALFANWIRREPRRKNFDRYSAIEPRIFCAVDFAHPARAKRSGNFIWAKFGAWREGHNWP